MNTASPGAFTIIPAIDLRQGRVVRLYQGDYARQTAYAVDPVGLAREYAAAGARWLHVVDLDGARDGGLDNLDLLRAICDTGLQVQAGGGVRSDDDVQRLLDVGVQRVVVGSVAIRQPGQVIEWLHSYGADRLIVALDTRWRGDAWRLPSAGWTESEESTLDALAPLYAIAGARHLLCTDIDRDGTLGGPNLALYTHLARIAPSLQVQVSGGARDLGDVDAARNCGASAVILGRALLERRFTVAEALSKVATC